EAAAVGVRGERPARPGERALLDERAALAAGAEAEVLEGEEHEPGEVIVDLRDVDVVGVETGARPEALGHVRGAAGGKVLVGHVHVDERTPAPLAPRA